MHLPQKTTLAIVQPYMTRYRRPVYEELAQEFDLTILCDTPRADFGESQQPSGFREHHVPLRLYFGGKVERQPGIVGYLFRHRPEKLICNGAPRNLTFWMCLFVSRGLGIQCFVHTQGPYKHKSPSRFQRLVYFVIATFADRLIMYAPVAADAIKAILPRRLHSKVMVAENSYPVEVVQDEPKFAGTQNILFIGRLRPGCGLELLLAAFEEFRRELPTAQLHIVGGGAQADLLTSPPEGVVYHGIVYDQAVIARIAARCVIGVYPGDAGLSVIHYLALGLPVVVHNDMTRHMGPEPSFIEFGKTGLGFPRNDKLGLVSALRDLLQDEQQLQQMSIAAIQAYQELTTPSLAQRIAAIINKPTN